MFKLFSLHPFRLPGAYLSPDLFVSQFMPASVTTQEAINLTAAAKIPLLTSGGHKSLTLEVG